MPAFQSLVNAADAVRKRSLGSDSTDSGSRKRQSTGTVIADVDGIGISNDPTKTGEQYWIVQWQVYYPVFSLITSTDTIRRRHPQTKKHKTWEGDGVLALSGGKGVLFDMNGSTYVVELCHILLPLSVIKNRGW